MLNLRPYQRACLEKIKWGITLEGNNLVSLPTGAGKSIVIAELANYLNQDVLIFQPSKEILLQNKEKLSQYVNEEDISIYSASLGEKQIKKYTFATIGSIKDFEMFKHFKIVIIDEAHLLNPKEESSMYQTFLKETGDPKVIGFTATPYRIFPSYFKDAFGGLYRSVAIKILTRLKPVFWDRLIFHINNEELFKEGFLTPLKYSDHSLFLQEEMKLNAGKTDFDIEAFDKMLESKAESLREVLNIAQSKYKHILVFCSTVSQAKKLSEEFPFSAYVSSKDTKAKERDFIINEFKEGRIQIVFNVGVLTTGFDFPALDCIVLMRPTRSIALYYQMLGRGVRKAEGKEFCHVIDLSNTVSKIGRVETIKLEKLNGKWELTTETAQDWHGKELYKFKVK